MIESFPDPEFPTTKNNVPVNDLITFSPSTNFIQKINIIFVSI